MADDFGKRGKQTIIAGVLVTLAIGAVLRTVWLTADPPTHATLGIVWHDEGPWVHNARNRALWGHWRTDEWNPLFIAPVFTAFEYGAFRVFGVGTWQARTVPVASGLLAIAALAAGVFVVAGSRAAVVGAILLATNYVFVMWNRVALMESTMTAFIVAAWAAYALAGRRAWWGLAAGAASTLAFFSKAAAAFFVAAIVLDAAITLLTARMPGLRRMFGIDAPPGVAVHGAVATLAGIALSMAIVGAFFVVPHWNEYQFYNWQVSVSRKPSYSVQAFIDRASWLPIVHDFFTRMWLAMLAASIAVIGVLGRLRTAVPAERLLVLWLLLGLLELVVHDAGNERRYVMFIPSLIALAAMTLGSTRSVFAGTADSHWRRWIAFPVIAVLAYLTIASLVRLAFLPDIRSHEFSTTVRLSAALAMLAALVAAVRWDALTRWLSRQAIPGHGVALIVSLVVLSDLAQFAQWTTSRTHHNYAASVQIGKLLPAGTPVHGKLANGLALENRIRPIFVGRGFGNYEDRLRRHDVPYVLTYILPSLGYESQARNPVIKEVLDAHPGWWIVATFEVRETEGGRDRAALIDKRPK
jgi:4-amino-4-deoxy-L-arabinose transferase-like glycosyltransferase